MRHGLVLLAFVSREAAEHRELRRVPEEEFIRMSREPGTVVRELVEFPAAARVEPLIDQRASKLPFEGSLSR